MRYGILAVVVVLGWFLFGSHDVAAGAVRGLGYERALKAHAAAARAAERREAEARQRRYENGWVQRWTGAYGRRVGQWARLAIRVGWPRRSLQRLGYCVYRESRGDRYARNPYSGCSGLLQLHPCWWRGKFDPFRPRRNLSFGLRLWRSDGWSHWGL